MTAIELEILNCENRIRKLMARGRKNGRIVAKLQRRLRALQA